MTKNEKQTLIDYLLDADYWAAYYEESYMLTGDDRYRELMEDYGIRYNMLDQLRADLKAFNNAEREAYIEKAQAIAINGINAAKKDHKRTA